MTGTATDKAKYDRHRELIREHYKTVNAAMKQLDELAAFYSELNEQDARDFQAATKSLRTALSKHAANLRVAVVTNL